jgi:FkbM family methyltransferase
MGGVLPNLRMPLSNGILTMPGTSEQKIDEIAARLHRLEDAIARLTTNVANINQGLATSAQDTLFSQAAYLGDHRALTYLRNGQKIFVDTRSVDIGTHILLGGTWEPNYMAAFARQVRAGDTVLDIGANHGIYALAAGAQVGPKGHVYAFEASLHFSELIRASISINGLDNVVSVINSAVAATTGEAVLNFDDHWSGGGHLAIPAEPQEAPSPAGSERLPQPLGLPRKSKTEKVRCVALDEYFPDPAMTVDVIKMDIEGAEGLALKGMPKLLERSPRIKIMMEFCPLMMSNFDCNATDAIAILDAGGFMCWTINPDSSLAPARWPALLEAPDTIRNILVSRQNIA